MRFNGQNIFGAQERQIRFSRPMRTQQELIPGVSGYRNYVLGQGPATFVVESRIFAFSLRQLWAVFAVGQSYVNGRFYTFIGSGGVSYSTCELKSYELRGKVQVGRLAGRRLYTLEIVSTVLWANPR